MGGGVCVVIGDERIVGRDGVVENGSCARSGGFAVGWVRVG